MHCRSNVLPIQSDIGLECKHDQDPSEVETRYCLIEGPECLLREIYSHTVASLLAQQFEKTE